MRNWLSLENVPDREDAEFAIELLARLSSFDAGEKDVSQWLGVLGRYVPRAECVVVLDTGGEPKFFRMREGTVEQIDSEPQITPPPPFDPTKHKPSSSYAAFLESERLANAAVASQNGKKCLSLLDEPALSLGEPHLTETPYAEWRSERITKLRKQLWTTALEALPGEISHERLTLAFDQEAAEVASAFHEPLCTKPELRSLAMATYEAVHAECYLPGDPAGRFNPGRQRLDEGIKRFSIIAEYAARVRITGICYDLERAGPTREHALRHLGALQRETHEAWIILARIADLYNDPPIIEAEAPPPEEDVDPETTEDGEEDDYPPPGYGKYECRVEVAATHGRYRRIYVVAKGKVETIDERDRVAGFDERYDRIVSTSVPIRS